MQRQKQQHRQRRSVGELFAAWLLVLWGVGTTWYFAPHTNTHFPSIEDRIFTLAFCTQGILCGVSGLFATLHIRKSIPWILSIAALCFLSVTAIMFGVRSDFPTSLPRAIFGSACLIVAVGLFFLGKWLGQQEDIED